MIDALAGLGVLLWLATAFLLMFMPYLMVMAYRRLRGVERALWAIVTQLQHVRSEASAAEEIRSRPTPGPSAEGSVVSRPMKVSMFGR